MHILGLVAAKKINFQCMTEIKAPCKQTLDKTLNVRLPKQMKVNRKESTAYHCGPPPVCV